MKRLEADEDQLYEINILEMDGKPADTDPPVVASADPTIVSVSEMTRVSKGKWQFTASGRSPSPVNEETGEPDEDQAILVRVDVDVDPGSKVVAKFAEERFIIVADRKFEE